MIFLSWGFRVLVLLACVNVQKWVMDFGFDSFSWLVCIFRLITGG